MLENFVVVGIFKSIFKWFIFKFCELWLLEWGGIWFFCFIYLLVNEWVKYLLSIYALGIVISVRNIEIGN